MSLSPRISLLPLVLAAAGVSCSHSPDDEGTEKPAYTRNPMVRAWSVQGARIPNSGGSQGTQEDPGLGGELLMGPDASLAGPGPLEEALANQSPEPLPEGAALGQNTGPGLTDGVVAPETGTEPADTPDVPVPRSHFDPALQNPPAGGNAPAPDAPGAPPTDSGTALPKGGNS